MRFKFGIGLLPPGSDLTDEQVYYWLPEDYRYHWTAKPLVFREAPTEEIDFVANCGDVYRRDTADIDPYFERGWKEQLSVLKENFPHFLAYLLVEDGEEENDNHRPKNWPLWEGRQNDTYS